jgi:Pin2-interacting protein X1
MMEKMGWKKGDGLGKNQSGSVDFIQIRYKNDEHGLGFNKFKMDDNWTQNETSFDELLKSLNNKQEETDELQLTSKQSLLEKSANSRARVHYKKRIQCKDVHKYSEKDLANILGKKTLKEESGSDVEKIEKSEPVEEKQFDSNEPLSAYESSLIVKSEMSMQAYFKNKMDKKKGKSDDTKLFKDNEDAEAEECETRPKKSKKRKNYIEPVEEVELVVKTKSKKKKGEVALTTEELVEDDKPVKSKKNNDVAKILEPEKPAMNLVQPSQLKGVNTVYGTNLIQIPAYTASKLANMSIDEFPNSNLSNIIGYGMTENTTIKVLQTNIAETAGNLDKYTLYNNDKLVTKRVNPRKILSSIKKIKKSIQVI